MIDWIHQLGHVAGTAFSCWIWYRLGKKAAPTKISPGDEAVVLCVMKLRDAERFAPPGSGFTITGEHLLRVQGELFRLKVQREVEELTS